MEMLSSFVGEKHEFCFVANKFKYACSGPSFEITNT